MNHKAAVRLAASETRTGTSGDWDGDRDGDGDGGQKEESLPSEELKGSCTARYTVTSKPGYDWLKNELQGPNPALRVS